jgi:hypothetical protein
LEIILTTKSKVAADPNAPADAVQIPRTERYLRNRPFLVIEMTRRPAKGVNTAVKGWADVTGNMASFEKAGVVDRVNTTHQINANVIIDVMKGVCVKNGFAGASDQEVVQHYMEKYRPQVAEAMDIWLSRLAQKVVDKNISDGVYSAA